LSSAIFLGRYRPMTLADLADRTGRTPEIKVRWKLVWEFLEEYRWEPPTVQSSLVLDEPPATGGERWDVLWPPWPST
jgi:hypothetical protein